MQHLKNNRSLIEPKLFGEIFHALPQILEHHEAFLSALKERLTSDLESSQLVGSVFIHTVSN